MYIPRQFEEPNLDVMHELIRAKPLATLVTLNANGIEANCTSSCVSRALPVSSGRSLCLL